MKAGAVKRLIKKCDLGELQRAAEAITDREEEILEDVEGDDMGERLTHILLAIRVLERCEQGEDIKDAFRSEMSAVRSLLQNP